MPARCFGDSLSTQHSGQLLNSLSLVRTLDRRHSSRAHRLFADGREVGGVGCNLREMSNTKHLVTARDRPETTPDDFSHSAPDPDIHFVKDKSLARVRSAT